MDARRSRSRSQVSDFQIQIAEDTDDSFGANHHLHYKAHVAHHPPVVVMLVGTTS
jgi:hypothetical protein